MCKICNRRPCLRGCPGRIEEDPGYYCPACGEELATGDLVYCDTSGEILGCEYCLSRRFVQDVEFFE